MVAAVAVSAAPASATGTLYVATTGTDTGNCQTSSSPCKTIGYALNQAPSAAIIQIANGTYGENPLIGNSVSLVGASQTKTVIDGGGVNTTVTVIGVGATVNLSDLTIKDGQAAQGGGISSDAQTLSLSHVTVSGNTAQPPPNAGAGSPGPGRRHLPLGLGDNRHHHQLEDHRQRRHRLGGEGRGGQRRSSRDKRGRGDGRRNLRRRSHAHAHQDDRLQEHRQGRKGRGGRLVEQLRKRHRRQRRRRRHRGGRGHLHGRRPAHADLVEGGVEHGTVRRRR